MRATLAFGSLFAAAALVAPGFAQAAAKLEISPIRITLPHKRPMVTLHLHNHGDQPTTLHLEGVRWTQADGKDQYAPDYGLVVTPPIATIPAGAEQTVRVGLADPSAAATETAYRVLIREVPTKPLDQAQTVQVLLQVSVPVFAAPAKEGRGQLAWTLAKETDGYHVRVRNSGPAHVQVTRLQIASAAGASISDASEMHYVLPGSTVSWRLGGPGGAPIANLPASVKLLAATDQGEMKADVRPD